MIIACSPGEHADTITFVWFAHVKHMFTRGTCLMCIYWSAMNVTVALGAGSALSYLCSFTALSCLSLATMCYYYDLSGISLKGRNIDAFAWPQISAKLVQVCITGRH